MQLGCSSDTAWIQLEYSLDTALNYVMFCSVLRQFGMVRVGMGANHVGRGTMAMMRIGKLPWSAAATYTPSRLSHASAESWTAPMSQAVVTPANTLTQSVPFRVRGAYNLGPSRSQSGTG